MSGKCAIAFAVLASSITLALAAADELGLAPELPPLGDVWITPAEVGSFRPGAAEQPPSPMTSIGEGMPIGDVWPVPDRAVRIVQPAAPAKTPENVEAR
jgi:hypothetical protein